MATEVIRCPSCRAEVRVPDNLLGTPVRCPRCRAYFRAPVRSQDGGLTDPELLPDPGGAESVPLEGSPVTLPGFLVLVLGLLGMVVDGFGVYHFSGNDDALVAEYRDMLTDPNSPFGKALGNQIKPEDITPEMIRGLRVTLIGFLGVSVVVTLGGAAMLARRFYYLCILASVLAILNLPGLCCVPGIPIGLWSLARLFDPRVRATFR